MREYFLSFDLFYLSLYHDLEKHEVLYEKV